MPVSPYHYPISKIFGAGLLDRLDNIEFENSVKSLLIESGIFPRKKKWDLLEAIKLAYGYLKINYRCEYIYKNEIANQLLLKHHNDNSATLLKELFINQTIADIVIVNGVSTAYEVKTELDTMDRLKGQIREYEQVFDDVNIVTYNRALKTVKKITPSHIGIIVLDNYGELTIDRPSISRHSEFNSSFAARILRQAELVAAYKKHVGRLPDVGSGQIGAICREWYIGLKTNLAHDIFNETLKSRKPSDIQFDLIKKLPAELKMLFLGRDIPKKDCNTLGHRLNIFD